MKAAARFVADLALFAWCVISATYETVILGKQPDPDMAD